MRKSPISPRQQESSFGIDELFFSTTNKKGIITAGNAIFARVSGYTITELLGKPHKIVRHPEMPRAIFKLLWNHLEAGKPFAAYVKNLAKDGSYYWVVALALPIDGGYLSIRFKPSSRFFPLIHGTYQELCDVEQEYEADGRGWKSGACAAIERLTEILAAHGFANYEAFMHAMLREELKSRQIMLQEGEHEAEFLQGRKEYFDSDAAKNAVDHLKRIYRHYLAIDTQVNTLFAHTDDYISLQEKLQGKSTYILEFTNSMRLFSLNAAVEAAHFSKCDKTLSLIATQLEEHAQTIANTVTALTRRMHTLSDAFEVVVFDLAVAKLQLDMAMEFTSELLDTQQELAAVQNDAEAQDMMARVSTLENAFTVTCRKALHILKTVAAELQQVSDETEQLHKVIRTLKIVYLNSKIEAAGVGQQTRFPVILEEVADQTQCATDELNDLTNLIATIHGQLGELPSIDSSINLSVREIESEVEKIQEAA